MRRTIRLLSHTAVAVSLLALGGRRDLTESTPNATADSDGEVDRERGDLRAPARRPDATALESRPEGDSPDEVDGDEDDMEGTADAGRRPRPRRGCPASMVRVHDYCVDRYEAPDRRGARPLVMQSADDAVAWCSARGKRLCTEDEWIGACEGDQHRTYPYGGEHVDGRCNDDKPWREVHEATLAKWPAQEARHHAEELYQATPSGSNRKCSSEAGVRDLTGNVEEWVVRSRSHANPWPYLLIGCYWAGCYGGNKPTCHSTNDAHAPAFRFYETGFRCCRNAKRQGSESVREAETAPFQ